MDPFNVGDEGEFSKYFSCGAFADWASLLPVWESDGSKVFGIPVKREHTETKR